MSTVPEPGLAAVAQRPELATLQGRRGPAAAGHDIPAMTCSVSAELHTGQAAATHLLAYRDHDGHWQIKPRCAEHMATAHAKLLHAVWPDMPIISILLDEPDRLAQARHDLIMQIATLWKGDWSGHSFDGKDGHGWLDTALHGDSDDLANLSAELDQIY